MRLGPELLELPQGAKVKLLDRVGEGIDYERLEAIAYTSFFEAFVDAMKSLGKGELRMDIDGRTLARVLIPRIIAENQRMGVGSSMSRIWLGLPGNEQLLPAME